MSYQIPLGMRQLANPKGPPEMAHQNNNFLPPPLVPLGQTPHNRTSILTVPPPLSLFGFVTFWTTTKLVPCMYSSMYFHLSVKSKSLMTCRTVKWFLSRVASFMSLEITTLAECHVTFGAGIWLLVNVGPFIGFHVIIAVKFFVTF